MKKYIYPFMVLAAFQLKGYAMDSDGDINMGKDDQINNTIETIHINFPPSSRKVKWEDSFDPDVLLNAHLQIEKNKLIQNRIESFMVFYETVENQFSQIMKLKRFDLKDHLKGTLERKINTSDKELLSEYLNDVIFNFRKGTTINDYLEIEDPDSFVQELENFLD